MSLAPEASGIGANRSDATNDEKEHKTPPPPSSSAPSSTSSSSSSDTTQAAHINLMANALLSAMRQATAPTPAAVDHEDADFAKLLSIIPALGDDALREVDSWYVFKDSVLSILGSCPSYYKFLRAVLDAHATRSVSVETTTPSKHAIGLHTIMSRSILTSKSLRSRMDFGSHCDGAYVWRSALTLFEDNSTNAVRLALLALSSFSQHPGETFTQYYLRFSRHYHTIRSVKPHMVDEPVYCAFLAYGINTAHAAMRDEAVTTDFQKLADIRSFFVKKDNSLATVTQSSPAAAPSFALINATPRSAAPSDVCMDCVRIGSKTHAASACWKKSKCTSCGELGHASPSYFKCKNYNKAQLSQYPPSNLSLFSSASTLPFTRTTLPSSSTHSYTTLLDSGANEHAVRNASAFIPSSYRQPPLPRYAITASGSSELVTGEGVLASGLGTALHIPSFEHDILSVYKLCSQSFDVFFSASLTCTLTHVPSQRSVILHPHNGLYYVPDDVISHLSSTSSYNVVRTSVPPLHTPVPPSSPEYRLHARYGHVSADRLLHIVRANKHLRVRAHILRDVANSCEICARTKAVATPYYTNPTRATRPFQRLCVDRAGPISPTSIEGHSYFVIAVDDYSGYTFIRTMRDKRDAHECLHDIILEANTLSASLSLRPVSILRSDNEFKSNAIADMLANLSIMQEWSVPAEHEQNGAAERCIRTETQLARSMLADSGLHQRFWSHAVRYAAWLNNRLPSRNTQVSPYQRIHNHEPPLRHARRFGSICYALKSVERKELQLGRKMDDRSMQCIFLGINRHYRGYVLYDITSRRVLNTPRRDVIFHESSPLPSSIAAPVDDPDDAFPIAIIGGIAPAVAAPPSNDAAAAIPSSVPLASPSSSNISIPHVPAPLTPAAVSSPPLISSPAPVAAYVPPHRRLISAIPISFAESDEFAIDIGSSNPQVQSPSSAPSAPVITPPAPLDASPPVAAPAVPAIADSAVASQPSPPVSSAAESKVNIPSHSHNTRYAEKVRIQSGVHVPHFASSNVMVHRDPRTINEAKQSPDWPEWECAIDKEIDSVVSYDTWEVQQRPTDDPTFHEINCHLIFKTKLLADGSIDKRKARLVADGNEQRSGVDFEDTYAPTSSYDTVRALFAVAAARGWDARQIDIRTAYLHAPLHHRIYMRPPSFLNLPPNSTLLLRKALYGTAQAGFEWWTHLSDTLLSIGLVRADADQCLWKWTHRDQVLYCSTWVDDFTIIFSHSDILSLFLDALRKHFDVEDRGQPSTVLGMRVERLHDGSYTVDQEAYTNRILRTFDKYGVNPTSTPLPDNIVLPYYPAKDATPASTSQVKAYQQLTGMVSHLSRTTRPDICFASAYLLRFNTCPSEPHFLAADHLLRYLKGTATKKLRYSPRHPEHIIAYADSDYCRDWTETDDGCSTSGFVFFLAGAPVVWGSCKQTKPAKGTSIAELNAAVEATTQLLGFNIIYRFFFTQPPSSHHQPPTLQLTDTSTATFVPSHTLYIDNQGALEIAKHGSQKRSLRFVITNYYILQKEYKDKQISFIRVASADNLADCFTKPLNTTRMKAVLPSLLI
jgi:hypothetical protein